MKVKHIQIKLFESNESLTHSNKAILIKWKSNTFYKASWIKWKSSTFKQCYLNQMKVEHIQTQEFESNKSQTHSNKAIWIKWESNTFKQS